MWRSGKDPLSMISHRPMSPLCISRCPNHEGRNSSSCIGRRSPPDTIGWIKTGIPFWSISPSCPGTASRSTSIRLWIGGTMTCTASIPSGSVSADPSGSRVDTSLLIYEHSLFSALLFPPKIRLFPYLFILLQQC